MMNDIYSMLDHIYLSFLYIFWNMLLNMYSVMKFNFTKLLVFFIIKICVIHDML